MRHEHLVVTVESGTKARVEDHLDAGESLEAWVADAIERKLEDDDAEEDAVEEGDAEAGGTHDSDASDGDADRDADVGADRDDVGADRDDVGADRDDVGADRDDGEADEYDGGFEFVDDCAI